MYHQFDIQVATLYGVDEAIMLHNLFYWIAHNEANNKHFYDGDYWTYNSTKAFAKLMPYWSEKQVIRILNSLKNKGLIKTGNYNETTYDRTRWFALTQTGKCICPNGQMELTEQSNGIDQTVKSLLITDNKPNSKTDKNINKNENSEDELSSLRMTHNMDDPPIAEKRNTSSRKTQNAAATNKSSSSDVDDLIDYFNQKTGRNCKKAKEVASNIEKVLKQYSVEDCKLVIDFITTDAWHVQNKQDTLSNIFKPTKFYERLERAQIFQPSNSEYNPYENGEPLDRKF